MKKNSFLFPLAIPAFLFVLVFCTLYSVFVPVPANAAAAKKPVVKAVKKAAYAGPWVALSEFKKPRKIACVVPAIKKGTESDAVYFVQAVLKRAGLYDLDYATGYYGEGTSGAVKKFQARFFKEESGAIDEGTAAALSDYAAVYFPECAPLPAAGAVAFVTPAYGKISDWRIGDAIDIAWDKPLDQRAYLYVRSLEGNGVGGYVSKNLLEKGDTRFSWDGVRVYLNPNDEQRSNLLPGNYRFSLVPKEGNPLSTADALATSAVVRLSGAAAKVGAW